MRFFVRVVGREIVQDQGFDEKWFTQLRFSFSEGLGAGELGSSLCGGHDYCHFFVTSSSSPSSSSISLSSSSSS